MDNIKVVVTGASGQLGRDMVDCLLSAGYNVKGYGKDELDVTNYNEVKQLLLFDRPNIIIHTAAYTKVDLAETEIDQAYQVNAYGSRNLAVIAEELNSKLVYISTDYVFDGEGREPYDEFMPTSPINIYGKSKLAGEQFVQHFHSRYFIVRTSWVYGRHGNNFVKTMLKIAQEQSSISVVKDQIGCPTYTRDLAECITELIQTEKYGIYHVSNSGSCSWFDFAKAIFELTQTQIELRSISSEQFQRPAKRPAYSVFKHAALTRNEFKSMRHWRDGLVDFIKEIY